MARRRVWGERAWRRVGLSVLLVAGSKGMRILEITWPVEEDAAFKSPSVPAE